MPRQTRALCSMTTLGTRARVGSAIGREWSGHDGYRSRSRARGRTIARASGEAEERSAAVVDLFERAGTPMGAAARADAAMAAVRAMTNVRETVRGGMGVDGSENGEKGGEGRAWAATPAASSGIGSSAIDVRAGEGADVPGLRNVEKKASKVSKPKADSFNPGSDFWSWTPPEVADNAPTPKQQRVTETRVSAAVAEAERVPEASLQLTFQSDLETPSELKLQFQSDIVAAEPALLGDTPVVKLEETATAVRELGADGQTEGTLENGSRWWRESGEEELEGGKLCRWTLVRGASADGSVEWEEKWWETSDAFNYRELGAIKSGRDATGNVWQESWREQITHDATTGFSNSAKHIMREANKWGAQADEPSGMRSGTKTTGVTGA